MNLLQATESVFNQLSSLLIQLKNSQYSAPLEALNNNSIGKHVRHIIEFYQYLIESNNEGRILDYDNRKRNQVYENHTDEAIVAFQNIMERLNDVKNCSRIIKLKFLACPDEGNKIELNSSIERELAYNLEHSIHHMAIIAIIIKLHYPEIKLEKKIGVAPSTIKYLANNH